MTTDNEKLRELVAAANQPPEAPAHERKLQALLVFRAGSRLFAAEARHVHEVVVSGSITPVPTARSYVLGITLVRGRVVPVVSLGELLGFQGSDEAAPTLPRLLIVREGTLEIAVMSDSTLGLFDIDVTDIGAGNRPHAEAIAGEVEFRGKLLVVLSVPDLLRMITSDRGAH
ncbi:MAG: chemotaxis protein CheW [Kofleriaceae bacterium]|nr:chemotaxis protein CheW [Kofleriaceae bacterium]